MSELLIPALSVIMMRRATFVKVVLICVSFSVSLLATIYYIISIGRIKYALPGVRQESASFRCPARLSIAVVLVSLGRQGVFHSFFLGLS